jgi:hypothetical protein
LRAPATLFAHHFVQGCVELARFKGLAGFHHLPAFPPVRVKRGKNILLAFPYQRDFIFGDFGLNFAFS